MTALLNRKVLLLNASYEALGTVSVPRAVRLIWKGSAEMVEPDGDRKLRSQHFEFDQPSVVRLIEYVDIRGRQRKSSSKRARIFARDGFRCQYCGERGGLFDLTMDHILPESRGGPTSPENLVTACRPCNQRKGDRTPEEARMPLRTNPAALVYGIDRAILNHEAKARPEWRKYLFLGDADEKTA
jgi:5-methylcytosine-specific restriction endonuclease McrA